MGSKTCKPAGSSTADEMSESFKSEATALEGVPETLPAPTPAESVVTEEKIPAIPVIPAGDVIPARPVVDLRTVSSAKSLTPMTQPEEEKDKVLSGVGSNDDDVIMERHAKKPRLHRELYTLSVQLGKAVESMNETSQAMISMQQFKKETDELHAQSNPLDCKGYRTNTTWLR